MKNFRLGEIAEVIGGVTFNKADIATSGIRILRGGNIQNGEICLKEDDVYLPHIYKDNKNTILEGDTILVASTGSVEVLGKAATAFSSLGEVQIGAFLRIIRPKKTKYAALISAHLQSPRFREYIQKQAKGTSINNIRNEYLINFLLYVPNEDSLVDLSTFYHTIDRKIALNRAINHNLEALITDIVDYEYLSNINSLPKRQIGDIASIKAGGDCPLEWSKERTEEFNIPIFSNGIENDGLYGYAKQATIFKPGITVAARGTIGFCVLREANYVPIIRLLAVTPHDKGGEIYLHQILNRITFKKDGSIQQQLTVPALSCIAIPYPDSIQLALFATKVYPIVEKIRLCKEQNEKLTKLRDSLLPLLMNGQVSLNYDLPAFSSSFVQNFISYRACSCSLVGD